MVIYWLLKQNIPLWISRMESPLHTQYRRWRMKIWGPFLESPETFRANFGWHNSLYLQSEVVSRHETLHLFEFLFPLQNVKRTALQRAYPSLHQINQIKEICIPYILLIVVFCITLEPNGKLSRNFVWLDMGLPDTEKESNTLDASVFTNSDLCCLAIYFHLCSTLRNFQVQKITWYVRNSCWWRSNMQRACCPFYASLLFENLLKKRVWSWTLWIGEIYLVAYEVCRLFAPMQWKKEENLVLPLTVNMLFVSMRKGWKSISGVL